ncbi:methylenetetrahydrofolate--tRNA-(uracil(54)-C(5))-methyltransferase (FADH(2)-oxidizing) TrmFO [Methylocapsa acidiphila]|uniref:methylenetetrahydrofolate--tRNA-(uracil(54)- C(5))-methyltransferase (FADH(2)-oxidizing) TrmFO n=1 Tax=Methylocapsa acidiphila TaxID=133552 RepID=UPI0004015094|nr:methylenetetrahydrofolate--tRNA-(uracil(54)-C(5))-methyltransferase (FADH(2)-oxidizing) TrmFO [Methylocapsa acidiphila]
MFETRFSALAPIHVIGGGLAGSEAAWQIARQGLPVILHEMRPDRQTPAHRTAELAELVCSNSFRADDPQTSAIGVLHREMRRLDSLIMAAAEAHKLPAGGALAVDRAGFSEFVGAKIAAHPLIDVIREEIDRLPPREWDNVIVATGPLTSPSLAAAIGALTGERDLAFYDAIAPVVQRDSIDMGKAWMQSRYDKTGPAGTGADYINCPLSKDQYYAFVDALLAAEKIEFREFEDTPYFNGCLPIEIMAERGRETLRHGPMKPFGLTDPHAPTIKPYAVVQLRQDNALGTLYNMVGFQTKLKHHAQAEVFRAIPGLEGAVFVRLGGLHRNTFLNAPKLLDGELRLKADPRLRFAGQITGCEGYVESAAVGLFAGRAAAAERKGEEFHPLPPTTALGALLNHITGGHIEAIDAGPPSFQPMNVNFGLFPPLSGAVKSAEGKRLRGGEKAAAKKAALSARAAEDLDVWMATESSSLAPA